VERRTLQDAVGDPPFDRAQPAVSLTGLMQVVRGKGVVTFDARPELEGSMTV
jgi:hypothetical protein